MYGLLKSRQFVRITDDANGNILRKIAAALEQYKVGWKVGFKMDKYTVHMHL